ncbi:hypothetical protein [Pedobacter sp. Leaf170]|uniref:hypothetical protein n=1 Tax=Pedobacter sp. Leaf170 TaxID=2876558 RepID=UPI001E3341B1|nr:hypothetical protein [Pedobacter sp. Leaf170]
MKPQIAKAIYKECLQKGYVEYNNVLYPPSQVPTLNLPVPQKKSRGKNLIKTGDVNDERNIRNKAKQRDMFIMLLETDLKVDVWPEFFFSTERQYRFDYTIPKFKIAIEQNGGIWAKGNSGHSSGKGIQRDMDKSALAASLGWTVISRSPEQMQTSETINLIKSAIEHKKLH